MAITEFEGLDEEVPVFISFLVELIADNNLESLTLNHVHVDEGVKERQSNPGDVDEVFLFLNV